TQIDASKDRFLRILNGSGIEVVTPNAGYFIMANFTNVIHKVDISSETDERFGYKLCLWFAKHKGIIVESIDSRYRYL
ncbi:unnamed protein product, partial [Oppiella nova]